MWFGPVRRLALSGKRGGVSLDAVEAHPGLREENWRSWCSVPGQSHHKACASNLSWALYVDTLDLLEFWWQCLRIQPLSAMFPTLLALGTPELLLKEPLNSGTRKNMQSSSSYGEARTIWPLSAAWTWLLEFSHCRRDAVSSHYIFSRDFFGGKMGKAYSRTFPLAVLALQEPGRWPPLGSFSFVCLSSFLSFFFSGDSQWSLKPLWKVKEDTIEKNYLKVIIAFLQNMELYHQICLKSEESYVFNFFFFYVFNFLKSALSLWGWTISSSSAYHYVSHTSIEVRAMWTPTGICWRPVEKTVHTHGLKTSSEIRWRPQAAVASLGVQPQARVCSAALLWKPL